MSDSEEDISKPLTKKTKAGKSLFRKQRAFCRKRAMQFLYRLDVCQDWTITDQALETYKAMLDDLEEDSETLDQAARNATFNYMEDIIRGVREHLAEIDELIRSAAKNWRLERMGPVERCLLRVAVFEMAYVKKVSAATAINEAIELSKSFGQGDTPRFVNGVLERIRQLLEDPRQRAEAAKAVAEAEAERAARLEAIRAERERKAAEQAALEEQAAEDGAADDNDVEDIAAEDGVTEDMAADDNDVEDIAAEDGVPEDMAAEPVSGDASADLASAREEVPEEAPAGEAEATREPEA